MKLERMLYDIKSVLFGVAVGDTLGVPVEFKSRQEIRKNPVIDMTGYGTYQVPAGTWSDDSSLTLCLAEALTHGFDLNTIGENFVQWLHQGYWTARGAVFDVGVTTRVAINRIARGIEPEYAGGAGEDDNGNGSLMRIAPLLFYLFDKPIDQRYAITHKVSAITHRHVRAVIACFYYLEYARQLYKQLYDLLQLLVSLKGKFILSNYWSQTLRYHILKYGWKYKAITVPLKVALLGNSLQTRTEYLIYNYNIEHNIFN